MLNQEATSKIIDDAREKIAKTPIETHKYRGKRYITLDGIDQLLALSGTTDIECPECGGNSLEEMATASNWIKFSPCHKCNGTGVIKHKWKVSVTLENGELPKLDWERLSTSNITNCGKTQRDMLNEGWVKEVKEG